MSGNTTKSGNGLDEQLQALAAAAGIATSWTDAAGQGHSVAPDTLRALLAVLDLPADSPAQIRESLARATALPPPRPAYCIRCRRGGGLKVSERRKNA